MSAVMNADEKALEQSLQSLIATHGYQKVMDHLIEVAHPESQRTQKAKMPSARYLMTLSPEEREPYLEAAAEDALPLYEADLARPEAERQLTADLETGDLYDYGDIVQGEAKQNG